MRNQQKMRNEKKSNLQKSLPSFPFIQQNNSKFQELKTVLNPQNIKKRLNLDQKNFLGSTIMRNQKKEGNLPKPLPSFSFI